VTLRTYSDLLLRPVRVVTDVELSGDGGKAGNDNTSARAAVSALFVKDGATSVAIPIAASIVF